MSHTHYIVPQANAACVNHDDCTCVLRESVDGVDVNNCAEVDGNGDVVNWVPLSGCEIGAGRCYCREGSCAYGREPVTVSCDISNLLAFISLSYISLSDCIVSTSIISQQKNPTSTPTVTPTPAPTSDPTNQPTGVSALD